ncbi:RNA-directed DNA polymerase [Mucilaginibacter lappiensis]|uniref:RNA-directed DNA polymerase n=1 Tax=Mucilaginibacter lappiensis TaxID=354630 RepID=UPI003D21BBA0
MKLNKLVEKGYFPEELPPPFNTKGYAAIISMLLPDMDTFDPVTKTPAKKKSGTLTKYSPYSIPKSKSYRRSLAIVHPLSFLRLAQTVCDGWTDITALTAKSKLSLSPLKEAATYRAIEQPSFDKITKERILRATGRRYALKVDIQRFYGSIYTHSIPWTLHTKIAGKAKRARYELTGNALDEDVRKMQDGQTMGIPIGPDTSRILSEIICSYIDRHLQDKIADLKGIRVVDDYTLYFKSLSDLETARAVLFKLLKDVELDLNQAKEKIIELPEQIETEWYNVLREYQFREDKELQHKDIIAYFDKLFFYATKFPDDAILSYGLSKISATIFKEINWPILEALLLQAIVKDSKCLPYVVKLIISHNDEEYDLDFGLIGEAFHEFIIYHQDLDNHYEVSWSLWLFKTLEIDLLENGAKIISASQNAAIILTALDMKAAGLIPKGLDTTGWESLLVAENLYNEFWLVAYEVAKKKWLPVKKPYLHTDPFFKILKDEDVEFYDMSLSIDTSSVKITSSEMSLVSIKSSAKKSKGLDEDALDKLMAEIEDRDTIDPDYDLGDDDIPF